MEYFDAKYNDGVIVITTNTKWSAVSNGNFRLSKCNGDYIGNGGLFVDVVEVILDGTLKYINGSVTFYYGLTNCVRNVIINSPGNKSMSFSKTYVDLFGKGTAETIKIYTDTNWRIANNFLDKFAAFDIGGNNIMIVSKSNSDFGYDSDGNKINSEEDGGYYFEVYSTDDINEKIFVYQKLDDNNTYLSASYIRTDKNLYTIKVDSTVNDIFVDFRYHTDDNAIIIKPNSSTLNVNLSSLIGDVCTITIDNDYKSIDVIIDKTKVL